MTPLEIARRLAAERASKSEQAGAADGALRDEYHRRALEALRAIGGLPNLGPALRALRNADPIRHRWVTVTLRDNLDEMWCRGESLATFQDALDRWIDAHRAAVRDYEASTS